MKARAGLFKRFGRQRRTQFTDDSLYAVSTRNTRGSTKAVQSLLPDGLFGHSSTLVGGKVYVYGGTANGGWDDESIYVLSLENYEWNTVKPNGCKPLARYIHSSCLVCDSLFVVGGIRKYGDWGIDEMHLKDLWKFDFLLQEWREFPVVLPEEFHSTAPVFYLESRDALVSFSEELLLIPFSSCHSYVPKQTGEVPNLYQCQARFSDRKFYVLAYADAELFSLFILVDTFGAFMWSRLKTRCISLRRVCSLSIMNGKLLLIGGRYDQGEEAESMAVYDIKAQVWKELWEHGGRTVESPPLVPSLPLRIRNHSAIDLKDRVLLLGGLSQVRFGTITILSANNR